MNFQEKSLHSLKILQQSHQKAEKQAAFQEKERQQMFSVL
jgi:hypothetical protein